MVNKLPRALSKALWARKKFYETKDFRFKDISDSYENSYFNKFYIPSNDLI